MAAEDITVQQDTASGPGADLNQGEAAAVNENLPTQTVGTGETISAPAPSEMAAAPAAEEDTSEPELASPADYEPQYVPETEDELFITGDTTRPDESVSTGAFARGPRSLSPKTAAAMPLFIAAASLPDAPEQLRVLMALLSQDSGS